MDGNDLNIFSVAGLPVSENDVKKPTMEFMLNLISVFFNKFHINEHSITQPLEEQIEVLLHQDRDFYEDMIKIINLHAAMSPICEKIFLKDFQLIDITSPSPKKTKKLIKFVANFVLFYQNKLAEIEESINKLQHRRKIIDEAIAKKNDALEKISVNKIYVEKQQAHNEKLRKEIQQFRQRKQKLDVGMEEKKEKVRFLEEEKLKVVQLYGDKKSKALKETNTTADMRAQVVEAPEKLEAELQDLQKQKESQIEERELKYEAIKEKKKLIERREHLQKIIQNESEKLNHVKELHEKKIIRTKVLENLKKDLEEIEYSILNLEKNRGIQQNNFSESEIEELKIEIEKRLSPLRDEFMRLSKKKKELEAQFNQEEGKNREIVLQINNVQAQITTLEKEISTFLKECQELYKKEISEELEVRKLFEDFGLK